MTKPEKQTVHHPKGMRMYRSLHVNILKRENGYVHLRQVGALLSDNSVMIVTEQEFKDNYEVMK